MMVLQAKAALSLLLLLLPDTAHGATAPCSDGAAMGEVSAAATVMLGSTAYVFPGDPCKGDKERFPCHYECDATEGIGAQWTSVRDVVSSERNVTQSITWVGPAAAAGVLPNGTEIMFMVGGGNRQQPCTSNNPDNSVCKGFKVFVAYNPDPDVGLVELSSDGAPELALATAAFVGQALYVIGGLSRNQGFNENVYRFDTTTMRWIEPFRGAGAGGSPFTPRIGLSSVVIGNAIFTVGGVELQQSGSSSYSNVVDILDLGRAGTSPSDTVHTWRKGPDALTKRAYAATFTMGCKVYVAGGATDGDTRGSSQNLNIVEIYSVPEGKTLAEGAWVDDDKTLKYPVSHVGAIVPRADAAGQEAAVVIGGLSGGDPGSPKGYCQNVVQPCDDPSRTAYHRQYSAVSCNPNQCAWGYVSNGAGQCAPCPGTDPLGSCGNGGCGGAFQTSGTCSWNSTTQGKAEAKAKAKADKLLVKLAEAVKNFDSAVTGHAQCTCTGSTTGDDCQSCDGHRAGNSCEKCKAGRFGPECKACPGLVPSGGGNDDPSAVCGGLGPKICIGAGDVRPSSGTCDCPYNYDDTTNCTTCFKGFWGLDQGCIECSCSARLTNATAKSECPASAICSGNGHCNGDNAATTVCVCDTGFSGPNCSVSGGGLHGGTIVVIILICLGGVGAFFIWRKNLRSSDGEGDGQQPAQLSSPVNGDANANYGTGGGPSIQNDYPPATMAESVSAPAGPGDLNASLLSGMPRDDQADAMFASLMQSSAASGQANYDQAGTQ